MADFEKQQKKLIKNTLRNKRKKSKGSIEAAGPVNAKMSFSQASSICRTSLLHCIKGLTCRALSQMSGAPVPTSSAADVSSISMGRSRHLSDSIVGSSPPESSRSSAHAVGLTCFAVMPQLVLVSHCRWLTWRCFWLNWELIMGTPRRW